MAETSEYLQSCIHKMKKDEERVQIRNYLQDRVAQEEDQEDLSVAEAAESQAISAVDRSHAVRLLLKIFMIGPFRQETFFSAVAIMDRYLDMAGTENLQQFQLSLLAIVAFTLAGKIEEQQQPSLRHITKLFKQRDLISHEHLVQIQDDILVRFGFDFNIPSIFPFVECCLSVIYNTAD